MKLYGYWRSSSAHRVRIALGYKGQRYENVPVHLVRGGGEQHAENYRDINPMSQVPVLEIEEGGTVTRLGQSLAIIEYLDERFPDPALLPRNPLERARVRELSEIINSGIQPFQNTGSLRYLAEIAPGTDAKVWITHFMAKGLAALEARAQKAAGKYLVGDAFSMADCCLIPQLFAARRFQVPLDACPTLQRVEATCNQLAFVLAAHPERQPDAEKA